MSSKYRTDVRAERYSRSDELDRLWRGQTAGTTTLITKLTLEQSRREKSGSRGEARAASAL